MGFYDELGFLVLGSRMRRFSESFIATVNEIYKHHKIKFDASWFPVFYILSRQGAASIKEIAAQLSISHSAVSQLISSLQAKGLIQSNVSLDDARKRVVQFTPKGQKLQEQIEPVWHALVSAMNELTENGSHSKLFLAALSEIEAGLQEKSLFERIEQELQKEQRK